MNEFRERQLEIERLYRLQAKHERRKEALAAVVCCAIFVGVIFLFLASI